MKCCTIVCQLVEDCVFIRTISLLWIVRTGFKTIVACYSAYSLIDTGRSSVGTDANPSSRVTGTKDKKLKLNLTKD